MAVGLVLFYPRLNEGVVHDVGEMLASYEYHSTFSVLSPDFSSPLPHVKLQVTPRSRKAPSKNEIATEVA